MRILKNDTVEVIAGNHRGKRGKVLKVFPTENRVIVEGVNLIKRHTRPSQANPQGGIVEKEAAIHVSNVMVIDSKTNEPTRIGMQVLADGKRARVGKKSGEMIATNG
jgi:large subunit ribosomal protein L24